MNYDELDAGIRETVRLLRDNGFQTTDSGDGTGPGSTLRPWNKQPHGHIAMVCPPSELVSTVDAVAETLAQEAGLVCVPQPPGAPLEGEVVVEGSYAASDPVGLVLVRYVLDRMWVKT